MDPLWLLKGGHEVPGWRALEADARAGEVDVVIFDRDAWALMHAAEAPTTYEGFEVAEPPDGLYVDQNGNSVCVVGRRLVSRPEEVVAALGPEAESMVAETGDVIRALERLGRAF